MELKNGARSSVVQDMVPRFAQYEECELPVSRSSNSYQSGQGMVEYALILVLVSIVVIVILLTMGNQIVNVFSNVVAALG
jgi:pilus assembly protein Flp/PilA